MQRPYNMRPGFPPLRSGNRHTQEPIGYNPSNLQTAQPLPRRETLPILDHRSHNVILLIDNYDSFTYNLVQRLGEIDPAIELEVRRNDEITLDEIAARRPSHLIISPGPCTPSEAGVSVPCVQRFAGEIPLLGVCLGHQSIGQAFGGTIVRAGRLMHGKTDQIYHDGTGLFEGLDNPFTATRYHSLVIRPDTLHPDFRVTAWSEEPDGSRAIMAIQHRRLPVFGVQFHPESFLTRAGYDILRRFLAVRHENGG